MQNHKIYSIFDVKAGIYNTPFVHRNDLTAQREMLTALEKKESYLKANAADYTLYRLGGFNDTTGTITAEKEVVITMLELVHVLENEEQN